MTNFITLLITTDQHISAKTFHRQPDGRIKESSYRCGSFFRHRRIEIDGIDDLFALLQAIETETQSSFLIQGEVLPEFRECDEITRTLHTIPAIRQIAMIRSIPDGSQWLCCDFDKIDLQGGLTPQQGVEMLVKTLPAEFQNVSYCYQLSSLPVSQDRAFGWKNRSMPKW